MVEQVKEKNGQQVLAHRQIDHLTESDINPATTSFETLQNDGLDLFFSIIRWLLSCLAVFLMSKEDISRALMRLPIHVHHMKFIVLFFSIKVNHAERSIYAAPSGQWFQ